MPRNYMFTSEQVPDAAIDLTREKGFAAVCSRCILGAYRPVSISVLRSVRYINTDCCG